MTAMQALSLSPLTEQELDVIEGDVFDAGTSFDWATGLLSAIITGPAMIPPSEWIPLVFGEGEFADLSNGRRKLSGIMRWYNEIAIALRETDDPSRPED